MKNIFYYHPETPALLSENSRSLELLFSSEKFDDEQFAMLIEKREQLISHYLSNHTLDEQSRNYIEAEIDNCQQMIDFSETLKEETRQELSKFVKSQNAIKNYK